MDYLAIKSKDGIYYSQSRKEREASLLFRHDNMMRIDSFVIMVFSNSNDCERYCKDMNVVNAMINKIISKKIK